MEDSHLPGDPFANVNELTYETDLPDSSPSFNDDQAVKRLRFFAYLFLIFLASISICLEIHKAVLLRKIESDKADFQRSTMGELANIANTDLQEVLKLTSKLRTQMLSSFASITPRLRDIAQGRLALRSGYAKLVNEVKQRELQNMCLREETDEMAAPTWCWVEDYQNCTVTDAYLGTQNFTRNGFACKVWPTATIRQFNETEPHNFCRNYGLPGYGGPWCNVTGVDGATWDYCFDPCYRETQSRIHHANMECVTHQPCFRADTDRCTQADMYQGRKNTTINGYDCEPWERHNRRGIHSNYCRIWPSQEIKVPSCYSQGSVKPCFHNCTDRTPQLRSNAPVRFG